MTHKELFKILKSSGLPVAYHHFRKATPPPLIVFKRIDNDNVVADNKIHVAFKNYRVELYTAEKSIELEEKIENIFTENEIVYEVDESYLENEDIYEIIYYIQI